MRFNPSLAWRLGVLVLAMHWVPQGWAEEPPPERDQVRAQAERLRTDPNMPGTRKEKTLRFKDSAKDESPHKTKDKSESTVDFGWWVEFVRWMNSAGRVLMWAIAMILVAIVLVRWRYWVRERAGAQRLGRGHLPSHVRDLDIRPESLPEDVGAAARHLWMSAEHRAALSLLYRGALSRLVHGYAVPIRVASTEGDCLALVARRLPAQPSAYFARLVQAWQLAVYGHHLPDTALVLQLCDDFNHQLRAGPSLVVRP